MKGRYFGGISDKEGIGRKIMNADWMGDYEKLKIRLKNHSTKSKMVRSRWKEEKSRKETP